MTTQTQDIADYYANLLILQYRGKPKASAMVYDTVIPLLTGTSDIQFLSFSIEPTSGTFKLDYEGSSTSALNYNASAGTIQTALQTILTAPLTVSVAGTVADGLTFTFSGYTDAVSLLSVSDNTLSDNPIQVIASIGLQLPLAVQAGFNLIAGTGTAVGVQLNVLGKYVGVTRSGYGFNGPITLNDSDFLKLIQMAIIRNSAGSSLGTIQNFINQFFGGEIYVFDYQHMNMSYLIDSAIGSQNLIEMFVTQGLLPRPMAVGLSVIVAPVIDEFFAFRTYNAPAWASTTPFQTYDSYNTDWLWLSYQDAVPTP